jgi:hypothetical protein
MNPLSKEPPYDKALAYGKTPNEALQKLYDWCVGHGFIKEKKKSPSRRKAKRYYPENAVFSIGKGAFQVRHADGAYWRKESEIPGGECSSCCFRTNKGKGACAMLACHSSEREDGLEVVFERI